MPRLAALLLASTCSILAAGPAHVETQHAIEVSFPVAPRWQITLHSRGRTDPGGLGAYQLRGGPIAEYALRPRVSLIAGYYAAVQERAERDVRGVHRPFGGVEWTAWKPRGAEVDARVLAERFFGSGADFTRVRNRVRISSTAPVAPYGGVETFFDTAGLRSVRYSAGLRWKWSVGVDFDAGYFYEPRRADLGPDRHMFLTSIHFRIGSGRRPDPDM